MPRPLSSRPDTAPTSPTPRLRRWIAAITVVALLAAIAAISAPGSLAAPLSWAAVAQRVIAGGGIAALWILAGAGIGLTITRRWRGVDEPSRRVLGLTLGVAIMLTLAHLMGVLGLYRAGIGLFAAWLPVAAGVVLLLAHLARSGARLDLPRRIGTPWALLMVFPVALLVVAACLPPGTIWKSEAHGYDVLSYHLQLPREWLAAGRIAPLEHNVYSFLPSAMESAFTQLGAMLGHAGVADPARQLGMGAGEAVYAAAFLHAGMAILAAWAVGGLVIARSTSSARAPAWIAAMLVLGTPWTIVTGSLAYNEAAVLLMFAGALAGVTAQGLGPALRGVLIGLLCGVAVNAKPTAMFMVVPGVALAVLAAMPPRRAALVLSMAAIAGLLTLAPWLVRNAVHCGNPVFPYATSLFGNAHWSAEQAARWQTGHAQSLSLVDRLARLLSIAHGLRHPQWAVVGPIIVIALAFSLARRDTHRAAAVLAGMLALQLAAWLAIGHLQPRFLMPILVPAALAVALALQHHEHHGRRHTLLVLAFGLFAITGPAFALSVFSRENAGKPNRAMLSGVEGLNGAWFASDYHARTGTLRDELLEMLGADAAINLSLDPAATRLLCIGDATPLYLGVPTVYATTWDRSVLADIIRADPEPPDQPERWIAALRDAGFTHVLINVRELDRLRASGWLDPVLTPQAITSFRDALGPAERSWSERGQWLHGLR